MEEKEAIAVLCVDFVHLLHGKNSGQKDTELNVSAFMQIQSCHLEIDIFIAVKVLLLMTKYISDRLFFFH